MRKIFMKFYTGYCGEEGADMWEVEDDTTDREIDEMVGEAATDHAMAYGREDDEDCYGIEGCWEDYVPAKHDMYCPGGGSFED